MTLMELAGALRQMYDTAPAKRKATAIHLFGIKYVDEIREAHYTPGDLLRAAGMKTSYAVEINKGMNLAEYVIVKNP